MQLKKKLRIIVFSGIFILLATNSGAMAEMLTRNYIREQLSKEDNQINLNKSLSEITQKAHQDLLKKKIPSQKIDAALEKMAKEVSVLLTKASTPQEKVKIINEYLYNQLKFSTDKSPLFQSTLDALLLNRVLTDKKGQCLSLSLIYLCLAERLGLPIYGVMVPNHFFVRYDNKKIQINIETTNQGKTFDDAYYRTFYLRNFNDRVSLKNLNKKQTLAIYLSNLANHYKLQGNHQKAMQMFLDIIKIVPNRASLYTNLGNTYERDKQILKAIATYYHSLTLNPYLCQTHYNLGLAHFYYTKMYDEARRHGEVARKLGCKLHPEFKNFLNNSNP